MSTRLGTDSARIYGQAYTPRCSVASLGLNVNIPPPPIAFTSGENQPSHVVEVLYLPRRSRARKRSGTIKAECRIDTLDGRWYALNHLSNRVHFFQRAKGRAEEASFLSPRPFNDPTTRVGYAIRLIEVCLFSFIMKINDCYKEAGRSMERSRSGRRSRNF